MMFKVAVLAAVVSLASAGFDASYMNMMLQMMGGMQKNHTQQPQIPTGGCANGQCAIPQGVDITTYMDQQKQQQQYQLQQMSAKIKAQFDSVMAEVTTKRHRYAMGVMTEFTSMCGCLQQQLTTYQSMFVANAYAMNMTDIYDFDKESAKLPYQATSLKDAKEIMFSGLLRQICTNLGSYMTFAEQVEQQLAILGPNRVTNAPGVIG